MAERQTPFWQTDQECNLMDLTWDCMKFNSHRISCRSQQPNHHLLGPCTGSRLGQGTAAKGVTSEHLRGLDKHTYAEVTLGPAAQRSKQQQRLLLISKAAHRQERKMFGNSASFSVRLLFSLTSTTRCSKTHTSPGAGNTVIATSIGRSHGL